MTDHNEFDDNLSGIFDELTPEDFNVETTAIEEIARTNEGIEAFNAFVDEQLRAFRMAWIAGAGNVKPIAVLASHDKQRVFTPDAEEKLGEYIKRLHREAVRMQAIWVFSARKSIVGVATGKAPDDIDFSDPEVVQRGLAEGWVAEGAEWYAERREGDENHHRFGIMQAKDGKLGEALQAVGTQASAAMGLILG